MVYEQENRSLPCRPSKPTLGVPLRENRVNTFGRELSPTCSSKCSSANSDAFSMLSADLSTVCSSPPPSSSDAQISPDAKNARMRVPSLDVIAARLHKFEGYQTNEGMFPIFRTFMLTLMFTLNQKPPRHPQRWTKERHLVIQEVVMKPLPHYAREPQTVRALLPRQRQHLKAR